MGWSITFTQAVIPKFLQNPVAWIRKIFRLQKLNSNVWNPSALFAVQNHHGPLLCTWCPKRWILATLWRLTPSQFGDNPGQVLFAEHAGPFKWFAWLQRFFQNTCCSHGHPKNRDYHAI
jgi:hypothetical protein